VLDGCYIGPRLELGWTWVIPEWVDTYSLVSEKLDLG